MEGMDLAGLVRGAQKSHKKALYLLTQDTTATIDTIWSENGCVKEAGEQLVLGNVASEVPGDSHRCLLAGNMDKVESDPTPC